MSLTGSGSDVNVVGDVGGGAAPAVGNARLGGSAAICADKSLDVSGGELAVVAAAAVAEPPGWAGSCGRAIPIGDSCDESPPEGGTIDIGGGL